MKYHVFIATTQGVVAIQDIIPLNDPDIQSLITVNGTATFANISHHYHPFVKKGSGLIHQDFGSCSYRANIQQGIDQGISWQLAMYIAHVIAQKGLLGSGDIKLGDQVFIATGEVNTTNRTILPIEKIVEKHSKIIDNFSRLLPQKTNIQGEENKPIFFMPQSDFEELQSVIHHKNEKNEAIALEAFVNLDDIVKRIGELIEKNDVLNKHEPLKANTLAPTMLQGDNENNNDSTLDELENMIKNENDNALEDELDDDKQTKAHRNAFDEDPSFERSIANLMYKVNPKHIVLRVVGFCGFLLFVIALLLTYVKEQQHTVDSKVSTEELNTVNRKLNSNADTLQLQKSSYLVSYNAQQNSCDYISKTLPKAEEAKPLVSSSSGLFTPINRHQLCQLSLHTPNQVNQVYWLDNNKASVKSLSVINHQDIQTSVSSKEWLIPLPEKQQQDITYFLIVLMNNTNGENKSSDITKEITTFLKNDSQTLKLTYQDLSLFLTELLATSSTKELAISAVENERNFLLYQHKIEVF